MEDQVPSSVAPQDNVVPPGQITLEQLELLKARAREMAIQQVLLRPQEQPTSPYVPPSKTVYIRRNLTVAELLLIFALSCGLVTGLQAAWNFGANLLPRLEIRMK